MELAGRELVVRVHPKGEVAVEAVQLVGVANLFVGVQLMDCTLSASDPVTVKVTVPLVCPLGNTFLNGELAVPDPVTPLSGVIELQVGVSSTSMYTWHKAPLLVCPRLSVTRHW